jgi:hypothetical protein
MNEPHVGRQIELPAGKSIFDLLCSDAMKKRYRSFVSIDVLLFRYSPDNPDYGRIFDKFLALQYQGVPEQQYAVQYNLHAAAELSPYFTYTNSVLVYALPERETDRRFASRKWEIALFTWEDMCFQVFGCHGVVDAILKEQGISVSRDVEYPGAITSGLSIQV